MTVTGPTAETIVRTAPRIHGRTSQRRAVAALLDGTAAAGAALVLTGEPGLGRTALLAHAAATFTSGPVVRAAAPKGRGEPLGDVRRLVRALTALTGTAGEPRDGTLAEGALPDALRAAARGRRLLVCVDDAHRWDGPSRAALAHAAARVAAVTGAGLLLTAAEPHPAARDFARLPAVALDPLTPPRAAALLDDATGGALDPAVRDELIEEAGGNPALLLALVRRMSPAELRGVRPLPRPTADAATLARAAGDHLTGLPPHDDTHPLLLTVSAALRASETPTVDTDLARGAARRLVGMWGEEGGRHEGHGTGGGLAGGGGLGAPDGAWGPGGVEEPTGLGGSGTPETSGVGTSGVSGSGRSGAGGPGTPEVSDPGTSGTSAAPDGGFGRPDADGSPDAPLPTRPREPYLPAPLVPVDGGYRLPGDLIGRALYARAAPESRRAAHHALAAELAARGRTLPALLHRAWATPGPAPRTAAALSAAAEASPAAPHLLRAEAHARAAELTPEGPERAARHTSAAEHALLAGRPRRALRLLAAARGGTAPAATRGRAELVRGTAALRDGPVADAHASLLLAASLLAPTDPDTAARASLAAADAAWAAGDMQGCLTALRGEEHPEGHPGPTRGTPAAPAPTPAERALLADYRQGLHAVLEARLDQALEPLRRVVARAGADVRPQALLKSAAAGLLLGDVAAARRAGARALAATRDLGPATLVPQALEYLAYAELRAGRHAQARAHAEEGLRTAYLTGQRNTAALHHAVLALAASIEDAPAAVAHHVSAALATARPHGLAQAATLAEWAAARVDLGRGRPLDAADRLGPLVRPGPRRGHFAVWMLAVPCYVEAAALAGRPDDARTVVAEFTLWADFGADPHAPAQLARCHALLAGPDDTDALYRHALARHEDADGDFERARTELLYGKWLRRRRRLREARDRLGAALVGFERCGARVWAEQARGELRAGGAAPHGTGPGTAHPAPGTPGAGPLARLTPQQLRIARHVAEGATNREVALRLAVSTRTVDYHLRNVFAALGVRSRVELARLVEQAEKEEGAAARPWPPIEKTGAHT